MPITFQYVLAASTFIITAAGALACTAAQGAAIEGPLLAVGTAICEAFVPILVPGLGTADVLGCETLASMIKGAVAAGAPSTGGFSLSPGGGASFGPTSYRPLRFQGREIARVSDRIDQRRAQAWLDAQAAQLVKPTPLKP